MSGNYSNLMRLFFGLAFLIGGLSLCLLDRLAHALANAHSLSFYNTQLRSFPDKQTYSRAELADAAWQVWTNRVTLPEQSAYTVADLKTAIVSPLLGTQQDSCERSHFEYAIRKVAGYHKPSEKGLAAFGFIAMLFGAFLLGGYSPRQKREASLKPPTPPLSPAIPAPTAPAAPR